MQLARTLSVVILSTILIVFSYYYVDRQVVWFLHAHHSHRYSFLHWFADGVNNVLIPLVFLYYFYYYIRLSQKSLTVFEKKLMVSCNAVVIGIFLKDVLKIIFARYWATTFICNNPSLLMNQVYGFNWFKFGSDYTSFPSGHTSVVFSFAVSMWFLFPKLRCLWALLPLLVIIGQIGMYYHFVSDVIAGATLGTFVALGVYANYQQSLD